MDDGVEVGIVLVLVLMLGLGVGYIVLIVLIGRRRGLDGIWDGIEIRFGDGDGDENAGRWGEIGRVRRDGIFVLIGTSSWISIYV